MKWLVVFVALCALDWVIRDDVQERHAVSLTPEFGGPLSGPKPEEICSG